MLTFLKRISYKKVIREFHHKLIEVSTFKIGIQLPKLWILRSAVLGDHTAIIANTEKPNMKMGKNFDPLKKDKLECKL